MGILSDWSRDLSHSLQRSIRFLQPPCPTIATPSFTGWLPIRHNIGLTNGVIHVLDSVILPASAETEPTMTVDPVCQSIVEIAAGNPDFSTLVAAVTAADLVETLSGEGPFTVLGKCLL